jgi:hypothetical protein
MSKIGLVEAFKKEAHDPAGIFSDNEEFSCVTCNENLKNWLTEQEERLEMLMTGIYQMAYHKGYDDANKPKEQGKEK